MTSHDRAHTTELLAGTTRALQRLGELLAQELPVVASGQIWRTNWNGTSVAGVALDVDCDDSSVEFAPFSVDVDYADPFTAVVDAHANALGVDIGVFAGLTTPVPMFTLDKYLGRLSDDIVDQLRTLWRANLAGLPPRDVQLITGTADIDAADPRRDYRNTLRGQVAVSQMAELIGDVCMPNIDLAECLLAAGLGPSNLVTDTIGLPYARQAAEGNAPVNATLAARIAELLGEPDPTIFENDGPALPPALARCLNTPQRFGIVRNIMHTEDLNETAAARRIPAIVKFRHINPKPDESEEQFWEHALDMLTHTD